MTPKKYLDTLLRVADMWFDGECPFDDLGFGEEEAKDYVHNNDIPNLRYQQAYMGNDITDGDLVDVLNYYFYWFPLVKYSL